MQALRLLFRSKRSRQLALIAAGILLLGTAALWHLILSDRLARRSAVAVQLQSQVHLLAAQSTVEVAAAPAADFTHRLHATVALDPVLRELQRSSQAAGVAFASVSSSIRAAAPDVLGRAELTVTMRGKYPDIKTVLSDIQSRFPHLVLPRLALRRVSSPNDIEARVDLLLLARPLHAPSAAAS